jgi:hypothetical protein
MQKLTRPDGYIFGRVYCKKRYPLGLEGAFREELSLLLPDKPSRKFMDLFGCYAEAIYSARGEEMPKGLARNELCNRAENIQREH